MKIILGDIHGELDALKSAIIKIKSYYREGIESGAIQLIFLGDYVDRGPDSCGVLDYLIELKQKYNCIFLLGNHDYEWLNDCKKGDGVFVSYDQGAKETLESYTSKGRPYQDLAHMQFLEECKLFYIDSKNNLFVHGGYNRHYDINDSARNPYTTFLWDRDLVLSAFSFENYKNPTARFADKNQFNWKFVGHTPTQYFDSNDVIILKRSKVVLCDVGCGKYTKELKIILFNEIDNKIIVL